MFILLFYLSNQANRLNICELLQSFLLWHHYAATCPKAISGNLSQQKDLGDTIWSNVGKQKQQKFNLVDIDSINKIVSNDHQDLALGFTQKEKFHENQNSIGKMNRKNFIIQNYIQPKKSASLNSTINQLTHAENKSQNHIHFFQKLLMQIISPTFGYNNNLLFRSLPMKLLLISLFVLFVTSQAIPAPVQSPSCQEAVIAFTLELTENNKQNENDKLSYLLHNITPILESCGLQQILTKTDLSSTCITDLTEGLRLIHKLMTSTNQFSKAFDMMLLAKIYKFQIKKSCSFLSEFDLNLKSSGVCLESAYQLSLTVQNLWQNLIQGHAGAAFKDFETFLEDLPDTLDACGDHALANKIRKDFPAVCLKSFEDLARELVVFEHNFDHLQWLAKHWKDLEKVFGEIKSTCPVFA